MADPIVITPGSQSSEFALTKYVVLAGGVLTVLFGILSQVQQSGLLPDDSKAMHVIAAVLAGVSMLLTFLKALGYTNARASVKVAAAAASGQVAAAESLAAARLAIGAGTTAPSTTSAGLAQGAPSATDPR